MKMFMNKNFIHKKKILDRIIIKELQNLQDLEKLEQKLII
jgi:hypothetical protein